MDKNPWQNGSSSDLMLTNLLHPKQIKFLWIKTSQIDLTTSRQRPPLSFSAVNSLRGDCGFAFCLPTSLNLSCFFDPELAASTLASYWLILFVISSLWELLSPIFFTVTLPKTPVISYLLLYNKPKFDGLKYNSLSFLSWK